MRVFLAYKPDIKIRKMIFKISSKMEFVCKAKAVELENIHLTFFFWQNVDELGLKQIIKSLRTFIFMPFNMDLASLEVFYRYKIPKVLNISVSSNKIFEFKNELECFFEKNNVIFEKRKSKPHFTVSRVKKVEDVKLFEKKFLEIKENFKKTSICLDSITLYQSILTSKGPIYKELYKKELKKEA